MVMVKYVYGLGLDREAVLDTPMVRDAITSGCSTVR